MQHSLNSIAFYRHFAARHVPVVTLFVLLSACVDMRSDVTSGNVERTDVDTLQPWPSPDDQGVIMVGGRRYVEAFPNETLLQIGNRVGEDPYTLADINGVTVNRRLLAGTFVRLPVQHQVVDTYLDEQTIEEPEGQNPTSGHQYLRHTVRPGETVYSIAEIYGISARTLAEWNGLGSDLTVVSGSVLIVPVTQGATKATDEAAPEKEPVREEVAARVEPESPARPVNQPDEAPQNLPEDPVEPAGVQFVVPLDGTVVEEYVTPSGHDGIDISAPAGSSVFAIADGRIALVSGLTDQSTILLIRHPNDVYSVYQHITGVSLNKEDQVTRGEKIAVLADDPGFLHFEIREGTLGVDPRKYFPPGSYPR